MLPPLLKYGIALEAHSQNVLARFDKATGVLLGFAFRDMGGLRIHVPSLKNHGIVLKTALPGSVITTDDLESVWSNAYHTIFANHLGQIMHGLGLRRNGGWAIVRKELTDLLQASSDERNARDLLEYFSSEKVHRKAFLRMKLGGIYRSVSDSKRSLRIPLQYSIN